MAGIDLYLKFCPTNCPHKVFSNIFKKVTEEKDEHNFLLSKYSQNSNQYLVYAWKKSATAEMDEDTLRKHFNLKKLHATVSTKMTKMPMSLIIADINVLVNVPDHDPIEVTLYGTEAFLDRFSPAYVLHWQHLASTLITNALLKQFCADVRSNALPPKKLDVQANLEMPSSIVSKTQKFATLTENDLLAKLNSKKEFSTLEWQEEEDDDDDEDGNSESEEDDDCELGSSAVRSSNGPEVSLKTAPPPAVQQNTTDPEVRTAAAKKKSLGWRKKAVSSPTPKKKARSSKIPTWMATCNATADRILAGHAIQETISRRKCALKSACWYNKLTGVARKRDYLPWYCGTCKKGFHESCLFAFHMANKL